MGTQSKHARSLQLAKFIIQLEEELKPLQQKLAQAKLEYANIFRELEEPAPPPPKPVPQSKPPREGSIPHRILALFETVGGPIHLDQIMANLEGVAKPTAVSALHSLVHAGKVVRNGKGVYAPVAKKMMLVLGGE